MRSITSLAILKANWDVRRLDYIDNFIPFFSNLIKIKGYGEIDLEVLKKDFQLEYGLTVPYHPLRSVLTRLKKRGLIAQREHKYVVDKSKIESSNFDEVSDEQQRKLSKLVRVFIQYCQDHQDYVFAEAAAEKALLAFFRESEIAALYAARDDSALPDFEVSKTEKYLVAKFVQEANKADPEIFGYLVDIAVGAALATAIVYGEDLAKFSGKNGTLNLYLDTGFLFCLLGVNGPEKEAAFIGLIDDLNSSGAHLFVFEHSYDELMRILNSALYWMNNGEYDVQKASRALKYFLANDFQASDVEMFIARVNAVFDKYNIRKVQKPSYGKDIHYQIDEVELKQLIIDTYSDPFFDEFQKEETINKDVQSIYSICKLRKGRIAYSLKDASHIFVTTNVSLARISQRVQSDDNSPFSIPPCITDVLLGTLIWLQNPIKTTSINEKKLMADAYAAIQPDATLVKKYLKEVDFLKSKGNITNEEYFVLRTHRVAFNLLSEKTRNDNGNFEPRTSAEILDEINRTHMSALQNELAVKRAEGAKYSQELDSVKAQVALHKSENAQLTDKLQKLVSSITATLASLIIVIVTVGLFSVLTILAFPEFFTNFWLKMGAFFISAVATLFGFNLLSFRAWLRSKLEFTVLWWIEKKKDMSMKEINLEVEVGIGENGIKTH